MHDLESKGEDVDVNDETLKKLEHHHLRNVKLQRKGRCLLLTLQESAAPPPNF